MFDAARMARRNPENPIHLFQMYAATAQGYTAIAEELLSSQDYDLFMMYFEQVDSFSHLFMKYAPPKLAWIDDGEFDRYQDVVAEWYKYQDELLGRVLAKIDLDETAVFLLSDHGFKSGDRRIRSERTVDVRRAHLDHETHGVFHRRRAAYPRRRQRVPGRFRAGHHPDGAPLPGLFRRPGHGRPGSRRDLRAAVSRPAGASLRGHL